MKSFNGRVAAITGAASGMGRALALALARRHLALADKNSQGLEQTLALIKTSTLSPVTVTTQVLMCPTARPWKTGPRAVRPTMARST